MATLINHKYPLTLVGIIFVLSVVLCDPAKAQLNKAYFEADRLLKNQQYEQAAEQFEQLYRNQPYRFLYLNKLTESLINLKKYDQAIGITQEAIKQDDRRIQAKIRLGELYHISGNQTEALQLWDTILSDHQGDQQTYLQVARKAADRKEYQKAIEIYQKLSNSSGNSTLVTSELGETYMQAGNYEEAIGTFLELVRNNPDRLGYVQRRLMRSRDNYIYDVAILEISDFLDDLPADHPSYQNLQQLEIWLLMERKLYKRAVATARNAESSTSNLTYTLYNVGSKLLAAQEFSLAEEAYSYYIDKGVASLLPRSREELANIYIEWSGYLKKHNLDLSDKREALNQKALTTLEKVRQEHPNYHRMNRVLTTLCELALNVLHDPKKAQEYLAELQTLSDSPVKAAQTTYIEGRLHLYSGKYTQARIAFTESNTHERIGSLAEKNRYYLALTDFFAGDYEFAQIQLNALQRQTTSFYANEAVTLRLWIQQGLQADSTGNKIAPFADIVENLSRGEQQKALGTVKNLFEHDPGNPLLGHALLQLDHSKNSQNARFIYQAVTSFLQKQGRYSPLGERIMWVKAQLADQIVSNEILPANDGEEPSESTQLLEDQPLVLPTSSDQLITLYEELLIKYPDGFYATYARERIQELETEQV